MCYTVKVLCIRCNLFAGTETLSLSVYVPIAKAIWLGGPSSKFWGKGVEIGGRVRYPMKAYRTVHIFLIETDTLSLLL